MKRPSFQFYPADWKNNSKLRRCSEAARGAWVDVLCLLHDSDEYGVCRWPLDELARAAGVPLKLLKELVAKDVLKGSDKNATPYIYIPRHAGKDGDPVTLVESGDSSCWYCSRFVRDEWVRQRRGQSTQFSADNQPPKVPPNDSPKGGIGERHGDGSTSSSTSSSTKNPKAEKQRATRLPADWEPSEADIEFCRAERKDLDHRITASRFKDYWIAEAGAKGRKLDWSATWRNWVRNERGGQQARAGPSNPEKFDPVAHVNRNRI